MVGVKISLANTGLKTIHMGSVWKCCSFLFFFFIPLPFSFLTAPYKKRRDREISLTLALTAEQTTYLQLLRQARTSPDLFSLCAQAWRRPKRSKRRAWAHFSDLFFSPFLIEAFYFHFFNFWILILYFRLKKHLKNTKKHKNISFPFLSFLFLVTSFVFCLVHI